MRTKVTFCSRIPGNNNTFLAEDIKALILAISKGLLDVVSVSHFELLQPVDNFHVSDSEGYPCSIVMFKTYL